MTIKCFKSSALPSDHWRAWAHWQTSNAELRSPYFRPEFTQAVAAVRRDVEIAVIYEAGEAVGFFPFERKGRRRGKPVGGRLSDYQAVIGASHLKVDPPRLLRECGLLVWDFDHLLASQAAFRPYQRLVDRSPLMEIGEGLERFQESLSKSGVDELKQTSRKARKLAREVGPLRLQLMSQDTSLLETLIAWKAEQYRSARITNIFQYPWTARLLKELQSRDSPEFSGVLSTLFAGPIPIASHMGMRSGEVLHWWFPAYDPQYGKYSPGRILLLQLAQLAPAAGIRQIDLGRGVAPYKKRVMSGATLVSQGSVDLRPISRALREGWRQTREWVRKSPLAAPARAPARVLYHMREWMDFR